MADQLTDGTNSCTGTEVALAVAWWPGARQSKNRQDLQGGFGLAHAQEATGPGRQPAWRRRTERAMP